MFIQFLFAQMFPVSGARSVLIMLPDPWALYISLVYLLPALKLGGGIKCQYRYKEPAVTDPATAHWPMN